jgi:hypothetical protein
VLVREEKNRTLLGSYGASNGTFLVFFLDLEDGTDRMY